MLDLGFWVDLWVDHVLLRGVHLAGAAPHLAPREAVGEEQAEEGDEGEDGPDDEPADAVAGDQDVEGAEDELADHAEGVGGPPGARAAEGVELDAAQPQQDGVEDGGDVHQVPQDHLVGVGGRVAGPRGELRDPLGEVGVHSVVDHGLEVGLGAVEAARPDEEQDGHGGVVEDAYQREHVPAEGEQSHVSVRSGKQDAYGNAERHIPIQVHYRSF